MKQILMIFFIAIIHISASAQIKEISKRTNAKGMAEAFAYSFTSTKDDTVTIKIVDPRGQLLDVIFHDKAMIANQRVKFNVNAKYWREGKYRIIVQSKNGATIAKGIRIEPEALTRKN